MSAIMPRLAIGLLAALAIMLSLTNANPQPLLAQLELHQPRTTSAAAADDPVVRMSPANGIFTVAIAETR